MSEAMGPSRPAQSGRSTSENAAPPRSRKKSLISKQHSGSVASHIGRVLEDGCVKRSFAKVRWNL